MGQGSSRNNKCSCGSGLKEKNCCKGRKPRNKALTFEMHELTAINGYQINANGEVKLLKNNVEIRPRNITLSKSYKKKNGKDKIISSLQVSESRILELDDSIKNFDVIFIVDTNSKASDKHPFKSISCVLEAEIKSNEKENHIEFDVIYRQNFLTKDNHQKPENEAWYLTIQYMKERYPSSYMTQNFGLVVDSDLGNISAYNNREKPFIRDVFLPPNVKLIYASSDVGKENIYNKLISISDKISNDYFKYLEEGNNYFEFENFYK